MEITKKAIGMSYWLLLVLLVGIVFGRMQGSFDTWGDAFHFPAAWLPPVGMLAVISGQLDLFSSIQRKNLVNIEARMYDLIHWAMLLVLNIGIWMNRNVPIWWFILTLLLLTIISAQVGVGLHNRWKLTWNEKLTAILIAAVAILLGILTGFIRYLDDSTIGWGWGFETITAIVATLIVLRWILLDLKTIRVDSTGYYRRIFLKGLFSNALVFIFWIHVMSNNTLDVNTGTWWLRNLGLTVNVVVGNAIYLGLYLGYEYYRRKQETPSKVLQAA
ncbi:MAG: hypothetical protein HYW95_03185 [Candidatus Wildermuthbacteria bacterium]|nr:hypothetical protein [Candidatus Wildermuthbacteria bacterium]